MLPDIITTQRLILRPFTAGDVDAVQEYSGDPDWSRFQRTPFPFPRPEAEAFVAGLVSRDRNTQPAWAVTLAGEVIGIVSLIFEHDGKIAVLGYGVHKTHWGKGLAVESASAAIGHAFGHCEQLRRIRAHTDLRNTSSIRVLQKLGFKHEGTLRANQFAKGEFVDEAIFGLLREERPIG